jgi:hypothetical protein
MGLKFVLGLSLLMVLITVLICLFWTRLYFEESESLKLQARLEDLTVWQMETTKSYKTYTYWMASWREGKRCEISTWEAPKKWMLERPCRRPGS